jgi:pyruvate dehydrogenase E2 component (dihydrolipoamide acetyltransferase)
MAIEVKMPKLSDTMEEGTILRWFKHEGDAVKPGEPLAEVETDKADMEVEAETTGVLTEIRVKEGEAAGVGAIIAVLDGAANTAEAAAPARSETTGPAPAAPSTVPPGHPRTAPPPPAASPLARVAAAAKRQEVSKLRLTVAKQMVSSKREVPHFYVTSEIDMSEAARLRAALAASDAIGGRITFTHLLIRALVLALQRHPRVNASWTEGAIAFHDDINIGVAVAVEDGLIAPVVQRCQQMPLRQIARAVSDLVGKAQAGKFSGDELSGATFTLSNLGMLDIEEFSAVITPPQAAILAVGAIKDRPVVREGALAIAKTMRVTLSCDHRVLNGMEAGRFLEELKRVLEHPVLLVIGAD